MENRMAAKMMPDAKYLREALDYDLHTGVLTWKVRPRSHFPTRRGWLLFNGQWPGKPFGTPAKTTTDVIYMRGRIGPRAMFAHRVIWKIVTGMEPAADVDHWDGDGLNNRWDNLRVANRTQTVCNARDRRTSTMRGAFLRGGRYIARVRLHGKSHYLGTYDTAEEAHQAYVTGTERLHEEFAHAKRPTGSDFGGLAPLSP